MIYTNAALRTTYSGELHSDEIATYHPKCAAHTSFTFAQEYRPNMVTAVWLLALAAPACAFIPSNFVGGRVRSVPSQSPSTTSTRMVAAPEKVTTRVERNQNFAKLKASVHDHPRVPYRVYALDVVFCVTLCILCALVI